MASRLSDEAVAILTAAKGGPLDVDTADCGDPITRESLAWLAKELRRARRLTPTLSAGLCHYLPRKD